MARMQRRLSLSRPLSAALALAACLGAAGSAAQAPASRGALHQWREAASFLQLSPEQWDRLRSARSEHESRMAQLGAEARSLEARRDEAGLKQLCQRATGLANGFRDTLRPMFTPAQLQQLAQLEQAFALMPIVQSAQAAGLIADRLRLAPAGLPQEQVTVESTWQRVAPTPLPGCGAELTQVQPGMVDSRKAAGHPESKARPAPRPAASPKSSQGS